MRKILIMAVVLQMVWACSEDQLDLYDGIDSVYFGEDKEFRAYKDTITFSFANFNVNDTVYHLTVKALGNMSKVDRPFSIEVESSTGGAGFHYDALETEYVIPAYSSTGSVPIRLHRTADLADTTYYLSLKLVPNENFQLALPFKVLDKANDKKKDHSRQVFGFTNQIKEPPYWKYMSLWGIGYWSTAKFMYVNDLLDINPQDWYNSAEMSYGRVVAISNFMKNHLTIKINEGWQEAVKDPKGPKGYMTVNQVMIPDDFPDLSKGK